jgi:hypothetical protein
MLTHKMTTPNEHDAPSDACSTAVCSGRWKLPVLFALVLAAIVVYRMSVDRETRVEPAGAPAVDAPLSQQPSGQTVTLTIQFADGNERQFDATPWHDGMTVADLMTAATRQPDGLRYALRGSGEMAFLTRIDDIENEGSSGRNWTYTVNGARADRSFAVYRLAPGDHVLWTFAESE